MHYSLWSLASYMHAGISVFVLLCSLIQNQLILKNKTKQKKTCLLDSSIFPACLPESLYYAHNQPEEHLDSLNLPTPPAQEAEVLGTTALLWLDLGVKHLRRGTAILLGCCPHPLASLEGEGPGRNSSSLINGGRGGRPEDHSGKRSRLGFPFSECFLKGEAQFVLYAHMILGDTTHLPQCHL